MNNKILKPIYRLILLLMAVTGFGQMLIFKRYYLADIPGFAWTADYYFTHYLHYLGAILLLALFFYWITDYFLMGRKQIRLTLSYYVSIFFMTGISITGIFRVLKNMPHIVFSSGTVFIIDITHLGLVIFFALAALLCTVFNIWQIRQNRA